MNLTLLRPHGIITGLLYASLFSGELALAQSNPAPLVLQSEGLSVSISPGDWIVVVERDGATPLGMGRFAGLEEGKLTILGDYSNVVSVMDIGLIYHGERRRLGHYTRQGLLGGTQLGLAGGLALGMISAGIEGIESLLIGPVIASFYTIPGGLALGFLYGLAKHAQADAYHVGPGQWKIVVEDSPREVPMQRFDQETGLPIEEEPVKFDAETGLPVKK
jgi:hypothetical protein